MIERHFAFFRQGTGEYVRDWRGPVPEPDIDPALVGEAREAVLNAWATDVSQPRPGEIGLDVTAFEYEVGDFCWMVFRQPERLLDWPVTHRFIQIDRAALVIHVNCESPRPIRSNADTIVIDITGTALEQFYGHLFGQLVRHKDHWALEPMRDASAPTQTQRALEAARIDLDFELVTASLRELAHV